MTKHNCEICRGSGTVRLPVYRPLGVATAVPVPDGRAPYQDFPCPECSDVVPIAKVHAERTETFAVAHIDDPEFIEHVRNSLAHDLASYLLRHGYIYFERGPTDDRQFRFAMRATIGVVTKKQLDSVEDRIAARQIEIAQEVVIEAKEQIDNWGARYGRAEILKRDARQQIDDAIRAVLARRAAWKPVPGICGDRSAALGKGT